MMVELSIVVPTLNECGNIVPLFDSLQNSLGDICWELIVVDDSSRDCTPEIVASLASTHPHVTLMSRQDRRGLASACIAGMKRACGSYIAVMDADGQHDASLLPGMLQALSVGDASVVIASRYTAGSTLGDFQSLRRILSRCGTVLYRHSTKTALSDLMSGFFALRRSCFQEISPRLSERGFKLLPSILRTIGVEAGVIELPYAFGSRTSGESKLTPWITLESALIFITGLSLSKRKRAYSLSVSSPPSIMGKCATVSPDNSQPLSHVLIGLCVLIGFVLRLFALHQTLLVHPDEIFQQLEPAHRLAFGYGIETWEWREGIRSWVVPFCLSIIMRAVSLFSARSAVYLIVIRVLLVIASLPTIVACTRWSQRLAGREAALIAAFATACWPQICVYSSHTLSEVIACDFLIPGSYYLLCSRSTHSRQLLGLCFVGLALAIRIQLLPLVLLIIVFSYKEFPFGRQRRRITMILVPLVAFGLVDWVSLGTPFQSYWKYVWLNVFEGVSRRYGVESSYWYPFLLLRRFGPLLIVLAAGARRSAPIVVMCAAEIIALSCIAHKEERFIYPLLPYCIIILAVGSSVLINLIRQNISTEYSVDSLLACCLGLIGFSVASTWTGYSFMGRPAYEMELANEMSSVPYLCGVGITLESWFMGGGYTYLHKNVPIVVMGQSVGSIPGASYDAFVEVQKSSRAESSAYSVFSCKGSRCLYVRPGECTRGVEEGKEINHVLKETGN